MYAGQRVSIPRIDTWQSEKELEAPWLLTYEPHQGGEHRGTLSSRLFCNRFGIQSRGLEYRLVIENEDESIGSGAMEGVRRRFANATTSNMIAEERVTGYFCRDLAWTDFVGAVPLVDLSLTDVQALIEGLTDIPLEKRPAFERDLMKEAMSDGPYSERVEAARLAFENVKETKYGPLVVAMATVEALYQDEKGDKDEYVSEHERKRCIDLYKSENDLFRFYAREHRRAERARKSNKKAKNILDKTPLGRMPKGFRLLDDNQVDDPRTRAYLAIEKSEEMISHMLEQKPTYITDALDRLIFMKRRIKGHESELRELAEDAFGNDCDKAIFGGYVRIFAEFLGHFASTFKELTLDQYKTGIVEKITSAE